MEELYEKLKSSIFNYGRYPVVIHENAMINSLNVFVNELYSKENYPNDTYGALCDRRNTYRNLILLVINDYIDCKLHKFPKSIEQLLNLIYQFSDTKLENPVTELGTLMKADMEKSEELREYSNEEWEAKLELAIVLSRYWDGAKYSNLYDIYNSLLKEYPRVGVLKNWDYGLDHKSCLSMINNLKYKIGQSSYLEDAKKSLIDKHGEDFVLDTECKNSSAYYDLLFNEILDLDNRYKIYEDDLYSDITYDYEFSDPFTEALKMLDDEYELVEPMDEDVKLSDDDDYELIEPTFESIEPTLDDVKLLDDFELILKESLDEK